MERAFLLGENCVTKAVGKVMELFGCEFNDDNCDILVMVDGDSYKRDNLQGRLKGTEKVLYVETKYNGAGIKVHPLCFFSDICPTYRIQLEEFSIAELGQIINDIHGEVALSEVPSSRHFEPNDIYSGEIFKKFPGISSCVKPNADENVSAYLHQIKNATWTDRNRKEAKNFLDNNNDDNYRVFRKIFYNEITWHRGYEEGKRVLDEIQDIGFNETEYPVLKQLQDKFKLLEEIVFPEQLPKNGKERGAVKEKVKRCFELFKQIEEIGERAYRAITN